MSSKKNRKSKLEDSDSDSGPEDVSSFLIFYSQYCKVEMYFRCMI